MKKTIYTLMQDNVLLYGNGHNVQVGKPKHFVHAILQIWKEAVYAGLIIRHRKAAYMKGTDVKFLKFPRNSFRECKQKYLSDYRATYAKVI